MILHDIKKPFVGKTGITQDTVYVVGTNTFIKSLVSYDVPVTIFKHDEKNLIASCEKIKDSELIVIESNTNVFLPILLGTLNQFATEIYIADDIYPEVFALAKSRYIKTMSKKMLLTETKKFFEYLVAKT